MLYPFAQVGRCRKLPSVLRPSTGTGQQPCFLPNSGLMHDRILHSLCASSTRRHFNLNASSTWSLQLPSESTGTNYPSYKVGIHLYNGPCARGAPSISQANGLPSILRCSRVDNQHGLHELFVALCRGLSFRQWGLMLQAKAKTFIMAPHYGLKRCMSLAWEAFSGVLWSFCFSSHILFTTFHWL